MASGFDLSSFPIFCMFPCSVFYFGLCVFDSARTVCVRFFPTFRTVWFSSVCFGFHMFFLYSRSGLFWLLSRLFASFSLHMFGTICVIFLTFRVRSNPRLFSPFYSNFSSINIKANDKCYHIMNLRTFDLFVKTIYLHHQIVDTIPIRNKT